ncbi:hypothetical protein MKX03_023299 [Papaver bracteatum]|nr:hypothetical protein MKX03_023299 [Papaver bracteatum]
MGCFGIICCVPKCIFKIIFSILIALGLAVPSSHKSLEFQLDLTLRNPNKKIGAHYDSVEARALYNGHRFASVTLTPFYQGHKNTTILRPVFKGQKLLSSIGRQFVQGEYNDDKSDGKFNIEVKLYLTMRFKAGAVTTYKVKPRVKCEFEVPLVGSNPAIGFTPENCKFGY